MPKKVFGLELKPEVTIGGIFAILAFLFTAGGVYANLKSTINITTERVIAVEASAREFTRVEEVRHQASDLRIIELEKERAVAQAQYEAIRSDLEKVLTKLERLEERSRRP